MELKTYFALDGNARVIPNVSFYVYLAGTNTLAPYLEDENGVELPNPFSSGTTGKVFFAAPNGDYDIRSVKNGVESVERVQFNDVSDSVSAAEDAADRAAQSAADAEYVVSGGTATTIPAPGMIPLSKSTSHIDAGWLPPEYFEAVESAADRAESAADAAQLSAGVYADTAAGLAATAEGEYFSVPVAGGGVFLILYRHDAGAATEIDRYPNKAAVDEAKSNIRQDASADEIYFAVADEAGFAKFFADKSGGFGTPEVFAGATFFENQDTRIEELAGASFAVVDQSGYYAVYVAENERLGSQEALKADVLALQSDVATIEREVATSGALSAIPTSGRRIIAHRGTTVGGIAPENTLDAYRLSARAGYTLVETDVLKTSDGQFVLMHDGSINRTCRNASDYSVINTTVTVIDSTLADLRANYVLAAKEPRFRRPIPTYAEFLAVCRDHGLYPVIELKNTSFTVADLEALTAQAINVLGERGFAFCSFSYAQLNSVRAINPVVELYYIGGGIANAVAHQPAVLYNSISGYDEAAIAACREAGLRTAVWTVPNSLHDPMLKLGIDEFATDTIAPELDAQSVVFRDYSDGDFSSYTTNGTLEGGSLSLAEGQTLTFAADEALHLYFGGYYLLVDFIGTGTLSANRLNVDLSNDGADYATYNAQCLLHNETLTYMITAGAGGMKIKDISLAIAKF